MKKILCVITVAMMLSLPVLAYSRNLPNETGRESRKLVRKEKREGRREEWLHSVNTVTETRFHIDFPAARDVSWTEDKYAEASFYDDGQLKTAYYDDDNTLVGTTVDVDVASLPEKARRYINKKYPDYTIERVIFFEDNQANDTDMILFDNSFEDKDNYFPVLAGDSRRIILKVNEEGDTSFLQECK